MHNAPPKIKIKVDKIIVWVYNKEEYLVVKAPVIIRETGKTKRAACIMVILPKMHNTASYM